MNKFFVFIVSTLTFASTSAQELLSREGIVAVPGGKVWYKLVYTEKSKNNPPLVTLHGGPGATHDYLEVLNPLAYERPVLYYDQLGAGKSKGENLTKDLWVIQRFVDELEAVTQALHFTTFHLYGHSWGATLALEYALHYPDKLKSLTLASPFVSGALWLADADRNIKTLEPKLQETIRKHEEAQTFDSPEYQEAISVYYSKFLYGHGEFPALLAASFAQLNTEIYHYMQGPSEFTFTGIFKTYDRFADLNRLPAGTLVTCGAYDEASPETCTKIVEQIPNGNLVIFADSSHCALFEEQEAYAEVLSDYLANRD